MSQGERPQKKWPLRTPWPQTSSFQNCGKVNFCCVSYPVCGTLLWQPWETNIPLKVRSLQSEAVPGAEKRVKVWSQVISLVSEKWAVGRPHGPQGWNRGRELGRTKPPPEVQTRKRNERAVQPPPSPNLTPSIQPFLWIWDAGVRGGIEEPFLVQVFWGAPLATTS